MTQPADNPAQRREHERVPAALPVRVDERIGVTRDVSASGFFFEFDGAAEVGGDIDCEVELDTPDGKLILKCRGTIVRTVANGAKTGVAIKISDSNISVDDRAQFSSIK